MNKVLVALFAVVYAVACSTNATGTGAETAIRKETPGPTAVNCTAFCLPLTATEMQTEVKRDTETVLRQKKDAALLNCELQCMGCETNAQTGYDSCVHNGQEFEVCVGDATRLYGPCMTAIKSSFHL